MTNEPARVVDVRTDGDLTLERPSLDRSSVADDLVAMITHELSTPLAIIKIAAEGALDHGPESATEHRDMLLTIQRSAELASSLLRRLRMARDVEAGTVEVSIGTVDLGRLVREAVDDLRHVVLADHRVEVTVAGTSIIEADVTATREIVFNLLSNAAKYSQPGAHIDVAVEAHDGAAQVIVRDHGRGVSADDAERIFGKFFQGDGKSSGAGLGLFISRGLAHAQGGDITLAPAANSGSAFKLTLPCVGGGR